VRKGLRWVALVLAFLGVVTFLAVRRTPVALPPELGFLSQYAQVWRRDDYVRDDATGQMYPRVQMGVDIQPQQLAHLLKENLTTAPWRLRFPSLTRPNEPVADKLPMVRTPFGAYGVVNIRVYNSPETQLIVVTDFGHPCNWLQQEIAALEARFSRNRKPVADPA